MSGKATRLYPLPALEIPARAIYEDLDLPPPRWRERWRPYVIINMVASVDGKTSVAGKAAPLGSETDRQTMRNLRSKADAVMIGANTLRAEKLSLGLDEPSPGSQPIAIIATGSGDVPLDSNLIVGERQEVLLLVPEDLTVRSGERRILRVPSDRSGNIDLSEALSRLKTERGVNLVLVEGGPTLNHSLMADNLVEQLFVTLAPQLVGGTAEEALTMFEGPTLGAREARLFSAYLAADELFLRYGVR